MSAPCDERYRRIYETVAAIPPGRVASYAEVARRAGLPRAARLVGRALAECPHEVPWHRVVNASGRISLPPGSAAAAEQQRRLAAEGVPVSAGRIAARYFCAGTGTLDALLWGPGMVPAKHSR